MLLTALLVLLQTPTTSASSKVSKNNNNKRLTLKSMSPALVKMEYAVRGKVVIAADKISEELAEQQNDAENSDEEGAGSTKKYPFDHIVYTNIGNPQSVGQAPLTWPRQVLALVDLPNEVGVDHPAAWRLFPADAIARAREIKRGLGGHGSGAYTHSKGARCFRDDVAKFIQDRDGGVPADPEDIYLTNGASAGIMLILSALIANPKCGTMIPIPQYPIYSAAIDLYNGHKVGYYLDEKKGWELNMQELERSLKRARKSGINVNSFVLINPGNPTGQVLSRENLHDIVRFCAKHKLVLLADEVYQENVYDDDMEFISCKRAAFETGLLEQDAIELISFHSVSKGVFGECGRRGGYMELVGIDTDVKDQIYKASSACLCSTVAGQIMTSLMVRGPAPSDESYNSHEREKNEIFQSLKRRAQLVGDGLNRIEGFSCQPPKGAMYCFPAVTMPKGVLQAAKQQKTTPDTIYAVSLLERTGICVVPASGFGQEAGRYGFRTTFLPSEEEMEKAVEKIAEHYQEFCSQYSKS